MNLCGDPKRRRPCTSRSIISSQAAGFPRRHNLERAQLATQKWGAEHRVEIVERKNNRTEEEVLADRAKKTEEMRRYRREHKDEIKAREATLPFEGKQCRSAMSHIFGQESFGPSRSWRTPSRSTLFIRTKAATHDATRNATLAHTKQRRPVYKCKLVVPRRSLTKSVWMAFPLR